MKYALILSGGSGTRLWPLSRTARPKHLISLVGEQPLLEQTLTRLDTLIEPSERFLITIPEQAPIVRDMARGKASGIIIEPMGRNNLLPMAISTKMLYDRDPDAQIAFLPSDHSIGKPEKLRAALERAFDVAGEGYVVTLGIPTSYPEPNYGHIRRGDVIDGFSEGEIRAYKVEQFHEKPHREISEKYHDDADWFWNAGIFIYSATTMIGLIETHQPVLFSIICSLEKILAHMNPSITSPVLDWTGSEYIRNCYRDIPKNLQTSIDYAIMEKAKMVATIPVEMNWSDLGGFGSLSRLVAQDEHSNRVAPAAGEDEPRVITMGSENVSIFPGKRAVVVLDCEDLIVVDTHDAILVLPRKSSRRVGEVVQEIRERGWNDLL